jgi:hypothetical protein
MQTMKGKSIMQQEQISRLEVSHDPSPDLVDVFMERLMHRLTPLMTQQAAAARTKLVGMSWVLAMLSLIVLGVYNSEQA